MPASILFAEFLTAGLRDALPALCHPDRSEAEWRDLVFSSGAKMSFLFNQTQGGILNQSPGIRTGMTGNLG